MFQHFITTAYRNLLKQKLFSLINIGGLAIGLAAVMLITLFVRDELTFDKHWADLDQLYRLEGAYSRPSGEWQEMSLSPGRIPPTLAEQYPDQISHFSRVYNEGYVIKKGNESFRDSVSFVDEGFFDIFNLPVISGNPRDVFLDNTSVVLTQSMAQKYFGDQNPVGEILALDSADYNFKVVAVIEDLPENTHLDFDMLSLLDPERYREDQPWVAEHWLSSNTHIYLKINNPANDPDFLRGQFPSFLDRNVVPPAGDEMIGRPQDRLRLYMMPVADIHLYSQGRFQMKPGGDILVVYSFSIIALLILIIAVINFVNLATAKASMRAREIALKKTLGATRKKLIIQFLAETAFTVFLALALAILVVEVSLPYFNTFIEKQMDFDYLSSPLLIGGLITLFTVVALAAGIHPALQISLFRPAEVLKSNKSSVNDNSKLRVILVTLQFAVSIALIITTTVVYFQTDYAKNKDLGFVTKNKLLVQSMNYKSVQPVAQTIKQEIAALPGVINAAMTQRPVPIQGFWNGPVSLNGRPAGKTYTLEPIRGDYDYLQFYEAKLLAGRLFSEEFSGDLAKPIEGIEKSLSFSIIINETAVRELEFDSPEAAVGQTISYSGFGGNYREHTIVGVIADMHLRSRRETMQSMMFSVNSPNSRNFATLNIHIDPLRQEETLLQIDEIWKRHVPDLPITRSFYDDRLGQLYAGDEQRGQMFTYFAIFAVLVSCLGLFGLASFTANRKTKEIGIRKVHGASIPRIIRMMTWQFSKPVIVANIIAWPVAWYFTSDWLQGFQFRIDLTPLPFIAAGMIALIIAWGTVTVHSYRVARTNPVKALRYE